MHLFKLYTGWPLQQCSTILVNTLWLQDTRTLNLITICNVEQEHFWQFLDYSIIPKSHIFSTNSIVDRTFKIGLIYIILTFEVLFFRFSTTSEDVWPALSSSEGWVYSWGCYTRGCTLRALVRALTTCFKKRNACCFGLCFALKLGADVNRQTI